MNLYVLDAFIWILGIRGHIPQGGHFDPAPEHSSHGAARGRLMRALAALVVAAICLSLVLWGAVWLALKLL